MPTTYPVPVFHFSVEGAGDRIGFTEVSGLNFTVEPIEYRDGDSPEYHVTKLSGMHKFGNITLKRGIFTGNNQLFEWLSAVNLSKPDRRTITIKLLDETHAPIITYTLNNAWPTKFDGVSFKSTGNELAIESVELVAESWLVTMS
jgi:phage tail-like protein